MFDFLNSETMWLNLTNATLGLVTLVCLVAVARIFIPELLAKLAAKRARVAVENDSHAFDLSGLGITMADGGERIDESTHAARRSSDQDDDPPNIIRSTN